MKICLFDPGLENNSGTPSANLGDLIIQEAVDREIKSLFGDFELIRIATHTFPDQKHIDIARKSPLILVGGTNLLHWRMKEYRQWAILLKQKIQINRAVLFGVGWRKYEELSPDFYTKISLKAVLSNRLFHSVRDNYTRTQLQNAGIKNVINTGCPTMWPIKDIKSHEIPQEKAGNVLIMFTDYSKEPDLDKKLLELALSKYKKIFIWPQGRGDLDYICSLLSVTGLSAILLNNNAINNITNLISDTNFSVIILEHSIDAFKNFLISQVQFDYIGTRLHGGIKCLLSKKRSLIIAIDNRAKEIGRETRLPTVSRSDLDYMSKWIDGPSTTNITLDINPINTWKSQFKQFIN
ncbi:polysaccharide pyruvyl transferase family protein [Nostocaceae cyanobacterium CENA369]|uniref:Polysaccharide pyruvyl transferase family protein n=1 Tax=Dendronalium phyllosphericum CENA369 TaxID=1725256 RepID=A0A8J7LDC3_9NOST|nr:polysaccharide pyruvyl transferase family protein [Dendronalium phyllosphericum]MBH8571519.1 polysaccharide pyruvyl transferase family protein [Dendronalium phyllosphericum CENA369]